MSKQLSKAQAAFADLENCPHCGVSLLGDPIPANIVDQYSGTHWKREIGVVDMFKYDGTYYFMCPDCKGEWGGYRAFKEHLDGQN
jgi:hypothetical protein